MMIVTAVPFFENPNSNNYLAGNSYNKLFGYLETAGGTVNFGT
jgi:hypothetical protein